MTPSVFCYLGLGSNMDDPEQHIRRAIDELETLPGTQLINVSPLYRSKPVGPQDQDDFINAVACISTTLAPHDLLHALQALEQLHQRQRLRHWGPRTLDLDILLYGEQTLNDADLSIPHPHMYERTFVLIPLADIAPGLTLPDGRNLDQLAEECDRSELVVLETAL